MIRLYVSASLFILLTASGLLHGWPQRQIRQEPEPSVPPISVCNVTFVSDTRSGRPPYPDPDQNGDPKERSDRDEKIIFPSEPSKNRNQLPGLKIGQKFVPDVPPSERTPSCAEGSTFCENSDNYPSDYLKQLLRSEFKFPSDVFVEDVVTESNITQRIDVSDEVPLCPSMEHVVYPKMAQTKDDKWLFVINQDQFIQGVRVEKCLKEGECSLTESIPFGYTTKCKQKYIYRKLVSLVEDGRASHEAFKFPSCCVCYYRPIASMVASRMGSGQQTSVTRGTRGEQTAVITSKSKNIPSKLSPTSQATLSSASVPRASSSQSMTNAATRRSLNSQQSGNSTSSGPSTNILTQSALTRQSVRP